MPRFAGIPVDEPAKKPRFSGVPVEQQVSLPPGGGDVLAEPHAPEKAALDRTSGHFLESRQPGFLEGIGNWMKDNKVLPVDQMRGDLQTADDAARSFANAATFNQADRLAAKAEGTTPEQQWERSDYAEKRSPNASRLAGIAGSVAAPIAAGKVGATLMRPAVAAISGPKGAMIRSLLMGAEGGAYGAAQSAGEGEDPTLGAITGGAFGLGGQLLGETIGHAFKGGAKPTSLDDMRNAKTAAYKAVRDSAGYYKPEAYKALADDIGQTALNMGIDPDLHKGAASVLKVIRDRRGGAPTMDDLDHLRQLVWRDAGSGSAADREFARAFVDKIDDFIDNAPMSAMAGGGNPTKAAADIATARELNRQYKNVERLDTDIKNSNRKANPQAALKTKIDRTLEDPRKSKFFNKEERDAYEQLSKGSTGQKIATGAGKFLHGLPGVGGSSALAAASLMTGGGAATLAPLVSYAGGHALKAIGNKIGRGNADLVKALLSGQAPAKSGMSPDQIQMLSRLLLGGAGAAGM